MEIERITPELVRDTFESWQRGEDPPALMLQLPAIQRAGSSSDLSSALYRLLRSLVADHLRIQRQISQLPPTRFYLAQDPLAGLKEDFKAAAKTGNKALRMWSALYYRSVVEVPLEVNALALAAGYSTRGFRRYVDKGVVALANLLREIERGNYSEQGSAASKPHFPMPRYHHPYGIGDLAQHIMTLLLDPNASPLISIEGIGGIGKTMLTQEIARRLLKEGDLTDILWISAQRELWGSIGASEPVFP